MSSILIDFISKHQGCKISIENQLKKKPYYQKQNIHFRKNKAVTYNKFVEEEILTHILP